MPRKYTITPEVMEVANKSRMLKARIRWADPVFRHRMEAAILAGVLAYRKGELPLVCRNSHLLTNDRS
jgi:hypothetical protein